MRVSTFMHTRLLTLTLLLASALSGCKLMLPPLLLPPPSDIGTDYSGPIYRSPSADAPRVVGDAPVLPVTATADCPTITETPSRKRSDCSVTSVMTRYNAGLQSLYQKRLANEPLLKGTLALRLSIAADGSVSGVDVANSALHSPDFIREVLAYVRTIPFGALQDVPVWANNYTVVFTPPQEVIPDKPGGPTIH